MSNANPTSNAMSAAGLPVVPEAARRLAAFAAETIAAIVTACAMRRAYRELAAFDDRLLADIGLDRTTAEDLATNCLRESRMSLAQLPWQRAHTSA